VRGGGEHGEAWHQAARGAAKANTVTDLVAVAEFLVAYGFTNPRRLVLSGEGAAGIAIGGAMARRPDLFAAVTARSPLLDLAGHERGTDGRAGSAELPADAQALAALSPYHQLRAGVAYPAALLDVSEEGGADAWHAAKLVARLRELQATRPALLRTAPPGRDEWLADQYAFAFAQVGEAPFAPPPPPPEPMPPERGDEF
jgi:prolyl oligopeptidase